MTMKKILKFSLTALVIMGFSQAIMAQGGSEEAIIEPTIGINERPAIDLLIEAWTDDKDILDHTVVTSSSTVSFGTELNDNKDFNTSLSTDSDALFGDDKGKGERDDLGNPPAVLELLEKQQVIHENKSLILYPNPAQNEINVAMNNSDIVKIEIFNMSGSLIYRCANGAMATQNVQIDLSNTSRGVYMLHVTSTENVSTKKFALR